MSDTDSFLQEVSEELRRDRLYRNIRKYGWIAILLVIVIVGAATYREYLKSQAETEAELFGTSIIDALNEENLEDVCHTPQLFQEIDREMMCDIQQLVSRLIA